MDELKTLTLLLLTVAIASTSTAQEGVNIDAGVNIDQPGRSTDINTSQTVSISTLTAFQDKTNLDNVNFTVKRNNTNSVSVTLDKFNRTATTNNNFTEFDATTSSPANINFTYTNLQSTTYEAYRDNTLLRSAQPVNNVYWFNNTVWSTQSFNVLNAEDFQTFTREVSDSSNIQDNVNQGFEGSRNVDENVQTVGQSETVLEGSRNVEETVSGQALVQRTTDLARQVLDTSTVNTEVTRNTSVFRQVLDTSTTTAIATGFPSIGRDVVATITGNTQVETTSERQINVQEVGQTNTQVERTVDLQRSVTDLASGSTQVVRTLEAGRAVSDAVTGATTIDSIINRVRTVQDTSNVNTQISTTRQIFRQTQAKATTTDKAEAEANIFRTVLDTITGITQVDSNEPPKIDNVTLDVDSLGKDNRVFLKADVSDPDGVVSTASYNDIDLSVADADTTVIFDLGTSLDSNGTITVKDDGGGQVTYNVDFDVTDNQYKQVASQDTIDEQTINKSDTLSNDADLLKYNVTHEEFGQTIETGGGFTGSLNTSESAQFDSRFTGDFLNESIQWHTRSDKYNTVDLQYIAATLNITDLTQGTQWTNINTTKVVVPDPFKPCDNCSSTDLSFTGDYFDKQQWLDKGDGVNNRFVQDIGDIQLGVRQEWWEEYRYNNINSDIRMDNVWANASINDNNTIQGGFVRVKYNNTFNNTFTPRTSDTCNTQSPDTSNFTLAGQTWRTCMQDVNLNERPEFFKVRIPNLGQYNIRYGGFNTEADIPFKYSEGDPCPDELEGDTFENGTLTCYRNEVLPSDQIEKPERNVSDKIAQGIAGLIAFIAFFIVVVVVVYREELQEELDDLQQDFEGFIQDQ